MKKIIRVTGTADPKNSNGSAEAESKKTKPIDPVVQNFESWVLVTNKKKTDAAVTTNKGAA